MAKKSKKDKGSDAPQKAAPPPWAKAHPRVKVNFSTKFAEELHMQMIWLTENVPKLSIQKIVQEATAQYVAPKIKELYKP
ncbi:hypothetical protein [Burkholderia pseudomallei]|uniref:hypothetical protein n=1 Tax=Burkholderia pseudomallei TaxID=28450 RepID=UPI00201B1BB0|nr:hypothetical protein [Burkholderia pseudomallei]MCL4670115.1 hypothetical protein [Burkholderia pseudomallei]